MRPSSTSQLAWISLLAYSIFLTALLVAPRPWEYFGRFQAPLQDAIELTLADYIRHFLAFSLLASLAWHARRSSDWPTRIQFLSGLLAYAILVEVIQLPIPERTFQWRDLLANGTGLVFGWIFASFLAQTIPPGPSA